MTHDEVLSRLFPSGYSVEAGSAGTINGTGKIDSLGEAALAGIVDGTPLGIDAAIALSGSVLDAVRSGGKRPIVLVVDTSSQNMTRRDEMLGLNEYLAHLAKSLSLASRQGHHTVSVLYGHAAAGAFIATSLSSDTLVAISGAEPSVMDLPSISRVTKLPMDQLIDLAKTTPIFAPGVDPLFAIGAVTENWPADGSLAAKLTALLEQPAKGIDQRDIIGHERKGRLLAHAIAERVMEEAARG